MARITFVLEDLPEGEADIIELSVSSDVEVDANNLTYAQEMAAILMGIVTTLKEEEANDSMSKVQDSD